MASRVILTIEEVAEDPYVLVIRHTDSGLTEPVDIGPRPTWPSPSDTSIAVGTAVRNLLDRVFASEQEPTKVNLSIREQDARFCITHLRYLADSDPITPDHAAASLSVQWLANQIEAAMKKEGQ